MFGLAWAHFALVTGLSIDTGVIQAVPVMENDAREAAGRVLMYIAIGPVIALIAGILILIQPRLLNYIVAIYLILTGLLGLLPR